MNVDGTVLGRDRSYPRGVVDVRQAVQGCLFGAARIKRGSLMPESIIVGSVVVIDSNPTSGPHFLRDRATSMLPSVETSNRTCAGMCIDRGNDGT